MSVGYTAAGDSRPPMILNSLQRKQHSMSPPYPEAGKTGDAWMPRTHTSVSAICAIKSFVHAIASSTVGKTGRFNFCVFRRRRTAPRRMPKLHRPPRRAQLLSGLDAMQSWSRSAQPKFPPESYRGPEYAQLRHRENTTPVQLHTKYDIYSNSAFSHSSFFQVKTIGLPHPSSHRELYQISPSRAISRRAAERP